MRSTTLGLFAVATGVSAIACQSYNMEGVDPQTLVAVETSGNFTAGKPPTLLVVQDRSESMQTCFGGGGSGSGNRCLAGSVETNGSSRMHVAQRVMTDAVQTWGEEVYFGLMLYGVGGQDPECGDPVAVAAPGPQAASVVIDAYANNPAIVVPDGGTPTTRALQAAYETLVDPSTGKVRQGERDNYVVLVTDGLMNCDFFQAMPCICASEGGCPDETGSTIVPFGQEGNLLDGRFCLDQDDSLEAVRKLRQAGVKTFVIGLGESFAGGSGSDLGIQSLNALAEAGGVPRDGAGEKFYSAANEQELAAALEEIIGKIVVPCEYELAGPVCDGRLVSIQMTVDGEEIATVCGEGEKTWQFAQRDDGSLDERRIVFSQDLCARFEAANSVKISIKGVESGCEYDDSGKPIGPACDLTTLATP